MNQLGLKKIIQNKRVYHKYFVEKELESGIVLLGWEVKSARIKSITIDNSYVSFINKEAYIYNSIFQPHKNHLLYEDYDPIRIRKLLLKKNELSFLMEKVNHQGYTIVVLALYWKYSWIKVRIGVAKGKKKYDKRQEIKKYNWKREKMYITQHNVNK